MWILRESQYPGLRLRHTQICVVLALCWNVVLACFGILFPCYSPWQRKRLNPCLASKCINSPMQDFARLCKTLQDIQVESLGQERNHSQAPRHPHQSRHRWRLPVMHPEDHKWCRWHRSRPVRTRVSVSHLRHVLIYIYMSNIFQSEVSTKRIRQCWRQESNELFEHMPHLESPWAKGGRPCRPVGQGQVRSSQVEVNLQVNAQENQKHFI